MSTYVLVHGSWHGGWCWDKLTPLLEERGHTVITPDLPGHGDDTTPISEITLASYVERVCEALNQAAEPVILVGHSMGGIVVSQTAEERPEQIASLVYLCAFLLQDGQSLFEVAGTDTASQILPNLIPNEAEGHLWVRDEAIRDTFYHDCSDADARWAQSKLCLEPAAPVMMPLRLSDECFGSVPRTYIRCVQDRALGPELQRTMEAAQPCERVIEMDTSHSPFISQPDLLAGHLLALGSMMEPASAD